MAAKGTGSPQLGGRLNANQNEDVVLAEVKPVEQLIFTEADRERNVSVRNISGRRISWKVKTTAPNDYFVRPNSGILGPEEETQVKVTLRPSYDQRKVHRFLIMLLPISDQVQDREEIWRTLIAAKDNALAKQMQQVRLVSVLPSKVIEGAKQPAAGGVQELRQRVAQLELELHRVTAEHADLQTLIDTVETPAKPGGLAKACATLVKFVCFVAFVIVAVYVIVWFVSAPAEPIEQ